MKRAKKRPKVKINWSYHLLNGTAQINCGKPVLKSVMFWQMAQHLNEIEKRISEHRRTLNPCRKIFLDNFEEAADE